MDELHSRRDEKAYRAQVMGEFPTPPPVTRIVANSAEQARLVADELLLPRGSWRLVRDRSDLFGITRERIAIADPPLGGITYREAEINDELWRIQCRDGGEFLRVST